MVTKAAIVEHIWQILASRKALLEDEIRALKAVLAEDTKSSMGDKYETSRAQAHLEMEKLAKRFQDIDELSSLLKRAEQSTSNQKVGFGNLVTTSNGYYFIGCGLGKIQVNKHVVFAVSTVSPIAKQLLNKKPQETISFNGHVFTILKIEG